LTQKINKKQLKTKKMTATKTMKASVSKNYGTPEVFKMENVDTPKPNDNEVLVRIHSATVTGSDLMMRAGKPYVGRLFLGISKPKTTILGFDFAGEVVEIGKSVSKFKVGDKVFGGNTTLGAYAEYTCVKEEDVITTMPENISFQTAAPVSGSAITVMNFLKGIAKIKAGDKVLINGASGSLGTYAIQIAKEMGAVVTGVCSTSNVELVYSLGADHVIDYTKQDFTKNHEQYNIIFDTVGKVGFSKAKNSLTPNGVYLSSVLSGSLLFQVLITSFFGSKKAKFSSTGMLPVKERLSYFLELKELLKAKKITTVIDHSYHISQMAAAHAYVEKGHKKGNIIINL
jgi:NADPH:quinone reductase-like Zn-dependent oxidoreductase